MDNKYLYKVKNKLSEKKLIYKFKKNIQSNAFLYSKYKLIFERELYYRNVTRNETDICIEAYPSSANTYLMYLLKNLNSNLVIAHHTHTIANVKIALKLHKLCVIIIRDPLEAISSYLYRFKFNGRIKEIEINRAVDDYYNFYSFIQKNLGSLYLVDFDDLIKNTETELIKIEKYSGLILDTRNIVWEELIEKSIADVQNKATKRGRLHKGSIPSKEKEMGKNQIKDSIKDSKGFKKVIDLYYKLKKEEPQDEKS